MKESPWLGDTDVDSKRDSEVKTQLFQDEIEQFLLKRGKEAGYKTCELIPAFTVIFAKLIGRACAERRDKQVLDDSFSCAYLMALCHFEDWIEGH